MDVLLLSRLQFAANISFHILFPTITIALGWMLFYFRLRYERSGDQKWMDAYFFWVKVFALTFGLGVVSGITMSFQFGTNWPGFMETVGNIAGPLLGYEVLTAFFLEAAFLGIMLFGYSRVPGWLHLLATFLVAFGTLLSAFFILVLNSWMHTPVGFEMVDGVAHATDWVAILFNPSMPYRLVHMLLASGLTASFLVAGLSAWRWLRGDRKPGVIAALRTGVFAAALLIPLQILAGDLHGLNTLEHQPAKVAAMEANWETGGNVPLILFAIPDEEAQENHFEIAIPSGASLILKHHADGVVPGLKDFEGEHPPVSPLFWGFRLMVGTGILMLCVSWWAAFQFLRNKEISKLTAKALIIMTFSGWVATIAGWYVTEIGRQPWLVQGVLKTKDAVAPVAGEMVAFTLAGYLIVYAVLLLSYIRVLYFLAGRRKADQPSATLGPTEGAGASVPEALSQAE